MKNGIILALVLIIAAGVFYFIENNHRDSHDSVIEQDRAAAAGTISEATDNSSLIREAVKQTKAILPMKIDAMTVFTDVVGGKNDITYIYEINMDTSQLPPEKLTLLKERFPQMICPQAVPAICAATGKVFLEKGIVINAKYKEAKSGDVMIECHYSQADCAKLPRK